jgi:hypothetical protein
MCVVPTGFRLDESLSIPVRRVVRARIRDQDLGGAKDIDLAHNWKHLTSHHALPRDDWIR